MNKLIDAIKSGDIIAIDDLLKYENYSNNDIKEIISIFIHPTNLGVIRYLLRIRELPPK